jgi:putative FmdB family regulatory protein
MPIYEFRCDACAEQFEELLRAQDADAVACPHCGSNGVTRLFSTFATEWKPSNVSWNDVPGSRAHD